MRTFSEFVENKEQDILKEYIQYCLENNIDIDEGLMDKFKQYGKAAVLAAAPFVAGRWHLKSEQLNLPPKTWAQTP